MNLLQLYYFDKLAELEHYGKAAKELEITQPALSNSMNRLEKELGVALFERVGRNIRLTDCGIEFDRYVKSALNDLDKAVAVTKSFRRGTKGIVRVAVVNSMERNYLPSLVSSFKKTKNAAIEFDVYRKDTYGALMGLEKGVYDIAFCSRDPNHKDFAYIPVKLFDLVAVVGERNPLAQRAVVSLSDLKRDFLVSYRRSCILHESLKGLFQKYNLNVRQGFDDEIGGAAFVTGNQKAIALMLDTVEDIPFCGGGVKTLSIKELSSPYHAVYCVSNPKGTKTEPVKQFLSFVNSEANISEISPAPLEDEYWFGKVQ